MVSTSSSSWTSIGVTVGVGFYIDVTVFAGLLVVVLGANHTVFSPIAEGLVVNVFGVKINLLTAS